MADEPEVTEVAQETQEPTLEDLQRQAQEASERAEKAESAYKDIQRKESRLAERERKLTVNEERLSQWEKRFDDQELQLAAVMDALEERGEPVEQKRKTRQEELLEQRKGREAQPRPKLSPDDELKEKAAIGIMTERGWDTNSPAFKKTEHLTDFDEILTILRTEAAAEIAAETDKKVQEAVNKVKVERQQKLKEEGATASEGGPSAASLDNDAFLQAYSEGKTDDHARAKKLMNI